jgi:hypothetical protein
MTSSAYKAFACEASRLFLYRHARESGHDDIVGGRSDGAERDSSRGAPERAQARPGSPPPRTA